MPNPLERLRTRLDELEAENNRLQPELEAERSRRREREENGGDEQGLFGFLRFGANRNG